LQPAFRQARPASGSSLPTWIFFTQRGDAQPQNIHLQIWLRGGFYEAGVDTLFMTFYLFASIYARPCLDLFTATPLPLPSCFSVDGNFVSSLCLMYLLCKHPLSEAYEAFEQTPHSLVTNSFLGLFKYQPSS
jgi:hypothetical protein